MSASEPYKTTGSYAVMANRHNRQDLQDDFPTPCWATRALLHHGFQWPAFFDHVATLSCLEPACGAGHMARPLGEFFGSVTASDAVDYGFGDKRDFLADPYDARSYDWVITNPPFRLAERFVHEGLKVARYGVAVLTRSVFTESIGRYERLFSKTPPATVLQFAERVPMVRGRLDPKASTATGYAWLIWTKGYRGRTEAAWIPPCRGALEREGDYGPSA